MDPLKEAFSRIRKDMESLNEEISIIKIELFQTREELIKICEVLIELNQKVQIVQEKAENSPKNQEILNPAHKQTIQTTSTHIPTQSLPLNTLKPQNQASSSGNRGVPTDRQTDRQTDTHTQKTQDLPYKKEPITTIFPYKDGENTDKITNFNSSHEKTAKIDENPIYNAAKILDSLDTIKKEIRLKFKRLTPQEMLIFSTLYQLEDEVGNVDYKMLANKLGLTESSVRDYIGRLIKKGIPVEKTRINNKTILLSVSQSLKKITSLSTIIQLRDL